MTADRENASPLKRGRLLFKLVAINVPMLAVVIVVVWLAIDYMAADYFAALIEEYGVSPDKTHEMFLDAVHRYLLWAALVGLGIALLLSYLLTRRMLSPLSEMSKVAGRIAAGDYGARVRIESTDEIAHLAESFNHMAENIQKVEELRRTMVADAAHELRTPLTNMRGYLEGLRDGVIKPSQKTFEMLHSEVLRLVRLAESLLALAKADAASAETLRAESVSLSELVQESLELLGTKLVRKGLCIARNLGQDSVRVAVEPDHLRQILSNLLSNAVQYSFKDSEVAISAERANGWVKCSISNAGPEISPDDLGRIFERFFRVDRSRSRHDGGAGIGLAIVKELVEAHGGSVGVTSTDCRTTFWLTLPSADGPSL